MTSQQIITYLEQCFTMPVLPATILVLLIVAYGVMVLVGALDFELLDLDIDIDADADLNAVSSAGFVALKFLNIGEVPVMIWLSVYSIVWWALSQVLWMALDRELSDPNVWLLVVRNVAGSVMLTKFATDPLAKVFAKPLKLRPQDLIGRQCEITTYEATTEFGQAKCPTEAAPILLDVKMTEGSLAKGELAVIVDYDAEMKVHYLESAPVPP